MTEQQLNGYQRLIPAQADDVNRGPADAEDLDVPEFLRDDGRQAGPGYTDLAEHLEAQENSTEQQDAVPASNEAPSPVTEDEPRRPFHRTRAVAEHRVTRAAARQVVFVGAGAVLTRRHLRDERTTARHHRFMRAAEAKGDHQVALIWEERASQHRAARHARRMQLLHAPVHAAKAVTYGTATAVGVLLLIGVCLAAANRDPHEAAVPLLTAVDVVRFTITLASILWAPAVLTAVFAGLMTLWSVGRKRAEMPAWLAPEGQTDTDSAPITPSLVVVALRELGIANLRTKIKAMGDNGATMLSLIRIAGCGVEVDVTLPEGTSTLEVQNARRKLAENLHRHEHEVFITIPPAPRTVRLWIADSGALDEPIGPSPLVIEPDLVADLYAGRAPWGQDLRGGAALISLLQRHLLITGLSNQGKTAALRALVLWALLDRFVEVRLADLKGVGDWRMLNGLATVLIQGPTDEHCIAATEMLEEGVTEMERRTVALEKSGATDGVTRDMARKAGSGFHPLILVVDEAQQAFMCPAIGPDRRPYGGTKATSRYFMAARKIHNQGRAVNVLLWQGTQDPTDQNLPKLVREGAHIRASLVVGTEAQARMALGDKAIDGGAAPHKLRQGLDKGTLVVAGDGVELPPGQASTTIRTHFVDGKAAIVIADRAKAMRRPVATRDPAVDVEDRDVLGDVAGVLGPDETLVKSSEVVRRLAATDPDAYAGWTVNKLGTELAPHAVVPYKTKDGTMHVDHAEVRAALDARESVAGEGSGA
jgi:S-DNA-T family DNA segregation ATPase FtsK/SpoIIIE